MITGIIFDLDGLLADTEKLHCRAYQTAMLEYGFDLSEMEYAEHWVRHGGGIVDWVTAHNLAVDPANLRARKSAHYLELLATCLQPMEGALELLTSLRGKMKIALASSSYRDAVDGVLAGLSIADFFEVIVSGLDVAQVKPAPEIFLKAANLLEVAPAQCLVLEDAEKGILAAHRAGMRSVAIPNDYTRHHDFSKATLICNSLREITPAFLKSLDSGLA